MPVFLVSVTALKGKTRREAETLLTTVVSKTKEIAERKALKEIVKMTIPCHDSVYIILMAELTKEIGSSIFQNARTEEEIEKHPLC